MQQVGSEAASAVALLSNKSSKMNESSRCECRTSRLTTTKLPELSKKTRGERCSLRKQEMARKRCSNSKRPEFGLKMLTLEVIVVLMIASISSRSFCETIYQHQHQLFKGPSLLGKSLSQVQQNSGKF